MQPPTAHNRRRTYAPAVALALLFALLVIPAALSGRGVVWSDPNACVTTAAADQARFHGPVIEQFAAELPRPDLVHYRSATTPLLHLALAVPRRLFDAPWPTLQALASILSIALVVAVWRPAATLAGGWTAAALALPFALNGYTISSAIWIMTDNASLLWVALGLGVVAAGGRALPGSAACALPAALTRQTTIWMIAPIGLAAALESPLRRLAPAALRGDARPWSRFALVVAVLAIAVGAVAGFAAAWAGLTPPGLRHANGVGVNWAVVPAALTVFAAHGLFFLPVFGAADRSALRLDATSLAAAAAGAVSALLAPTTYSRTDGRWGGIVWSAVQATPAVAERSLLLVVGGAAGAYVLCAAWRAASSAGRGREAALLLVGVAGWLAALVAGRLAFQRYFDPMVLLMLCWLGAMALSRPIAGGARRAAMTAVLVSALVQLALVVWTIFIPLLRWTDA